jgi:hypothetical protein
MDKLTKYRELIKRHLLQIEEICNRRPNPNRETLCVFDDQRDRYLLVVTGWFQNRRVRGNTLFVRLKEGKIWIEEDWTEDGIALDLVRAGVPKEDIVLAFHPPEVRPATEFATT